MIHCLQETFVAKCVSMATARHGFTKKGLPRGKPVTTYEAFMKSLPSDMSKEMRAAKWKGQQAATANCHKAQVASLALAPVDVNTSTREELATIPGILLRIVDALVHHRSQSGDRYQTGEDLLKIPGLGRATLRTISPFIKFIQLGGLSSNGRALASHARGTGIDTLRLHFLRNRKCRSASVFSFGHIFGVWISCYARQGGALPLTGSRSSRTWAPCT